MPEPTVQPQIHKIHTQNHGQEEKRLRVSLSSAQAMSVLWRKGDPEAQNVESIPSDRPQQFDAPSKPASDAGIRFFPGRKAVCVTPGSFRITFAEFQNDEEATTGLMDISFSAHGKTRSKEGTGIDRLFGRGERIIDSEGNVCDCDCMIYRQFIRGLAFQRLPDQSDFQQVRTFTSGRHKDENQLTLTQNEWTEEDTFNICNPPRYGCTRGNCEDNPGVESGAASGIDVRLRYNFLLQIWDICQQQAAKESQQTLTITGATVPRTIQWDPGWLPLSAIVPDQTGDGQPSEQPAGTEPKTSASVQNAA